MSSITSVRVSHHRAATSRDTLRQQKQTHAYCKGLSIEQACPERADGSDWRLLARLPGVVHQLTHLHERELTPLIGMGWHEAEKAPYDISS
jgi:hypothetical protein